MLTTDRLILRGMKPSDEEPLQMYDDNRVAPWISESYIIPKHASYSTKLAGFMESCLISCIIEEKPKPKEEENRGSSSSSFVGVIGFLALSEAKNRNAVLWLAIAPEQWGKGYATEAITFLVDYAFVELGMHKVSLSVFAGNERAVDLYRRMSVTGYFAFSESRLNMPSLT